LFGAPPVTLATLRPASSCFSSLSCSTHNTTPSQRHVRAGVVDQSGATAVPAHPASLLRGARDLGRSHGYIMRGPQPTQQHRSSERRTWPRSSALFLGRSSCARTLAAKITSIIIKLVQHNIMLSRCRPSLNQARRPITRGTRPGGSQTHPLQLSSRKYRSKEARRWLGAPHTACFGCWRRPDPGGGPACSPSSGGGEARVSEASPQRWRSTRGCIGYDYICANRSPQFGSRETR
jgi:hypothetical protein